MKARKMISILIIMGLMLSLFGGIGVAAEDTVTSVEFESGSPVHLYVSETSVQLKLLAVISGATTKKDVTSDAYWVSSNPSAVKVEKGLLTPLGKADNVIITAKYKGNEATIRVTSEYLFEKLDIDKTDGTRLLLGDMDEALQVYTVDEDGDRYDVSDKAVWTSSSSAVLTVAQGKLTPVSKGTATITAEYKGLKDSVKIEVASPYKQLKLEPGESMDMTVGQEPVALKAIVQSINDGTAPQDATDDAVWKSSNPSIATVEDGVVKAVGQGIVKISAARLGVSAEVSVTVRLPYQAFTLSQSKDVWMFMSDAPLEIKAKALNDANDTVDVTEAAEWSSSNTLVAIVSGGKVIPKAPGTTKIKAAYRGLSKEFTLTVLKNVGTLQFADSGLSMFVGESKALPTIKATSVSEESMDVLPIATWTSSDNTVATVDGTKLVAKKAGKIELKAAAQGLTASVTVTVYNKLTALVPAVSSVSGVVGKEVQLPSINAFYDNGEENVVSDPIDWKTNSKTILIKDGKVKGISAGKSSVTGTFLNRTVTISVIFETELTSLKAEDESVVLNPGKTKTVKITGWFADGRSQSLAAKMNLVSSNPSVVTVKGATLKAVAAGSAVISGSYQGKKVEIKVTVVLAIKKLEASDKIIRLKAGESKTVTVTAIYDGKTADATSQSVWSAGNSAIAQVRQGVITGVKKGTTVVKAVFDKKTVLIRINVE